MQTVCTARDELQWFIYNSSRSFFLALRFLKENTVKNKWQLRRERSFKDVKSRF